ncbi:jg20586 [Pararge aegeria aegeria]|uniref:Jg20586 protein n=2 Tax=Pararge aegeria TaxID=116150 RepID=A0A8S4RT10_9NEOP|nr:jg20586 [Pararge aegeria aegeria]
MFGLAILLAAGATLASGLANTPYVQSREAFTHARTLISEYLAPQDGDMHDPEARKHFSFGILAGVTAGLVTANRTDPAYNPLLVLDKTFPHAWRNYKQISQRGQTLLNEASAKINLIEDLIDNLCDAESVEQCNIKVNAKVQRNPHAYKLPADLLLLLGSVSDAIRDLEPTINTVTKGRTEIPYLIDNVQTSEFRTLVEDLADTYHKMRELHFRRYNPHIL